MLKYFVTIIKKLITVTNRFFFYSNVINQNINNPLQNTKQQQIQNNEDVFQKKKKSLVRGHETSFFYILTCLQRTLKM